MAVIRDCESYQIPSPPGNYFTPNSANVHKKFPVHRGNGLPVVDPIGIGVLGGLRRSVLLSNPS
jgi:hypothetical protein